MSRRFYGLARRNVEDGRTATPVGNDEIHREVLAIHRVVYVLQHCGRRVVGEQLEIVAMKERRSRENEMVRVVVVSSVSQTAVEFLTLHLTMESNETPRIALMEMKQRNGTQRKFPNAGV